MSNTCWSNKSCSSRNSPSVPFSCGQSTAAVDALIPPLIDEIAAKASTRLPVFVFTMSEAIRERSSCGASATSRTRPLAAPDGSYTVAPNNSLRASVVIPLEDNQLQAHAKQISVVGRCVLPISPEIADRKIPLPPVCCAGGQWFAMEGVAVESFGTEVQVRCAEFLGLAQEEESPGLEVEVQTFKQRGALRAREMW